jgi:hypothetical protein
VDLPARLRVGEWRRGEEGEDDHGDEQPLHGPTPDAAMLRREAVGRQRARHRLLS